MSHRRVQQLAVLLLHDRLLARRLHEDPDATLADEDLSDAERRWLRAVDPRAWRTDPHRTDRLLTALLEEYATAGWLVYRLPKGLERLRAFFSSAFFHACVGERGSLAGSFGAYLRETVAPAAGTRATAIDALASLEAAIAAVRRRAREAAPVARGEEAGEGPWVRSPLVELACVPAGTLVLHQHLAALLAERVAAGGSVVGAILEGEPPPSTMPALETSAPERLLVESAAAGDGSATVAPVPEGLAALVEAARIPVDTDSLLAVARSLGADPGEDREVVQNLVRDGLLVAAAHEPRNP